MKTRFNTIDIRALVTNLSSILGMRVANIYDINHRTYLLKLAKPEHKAFLVLESGTRLHTTEFSREKSDIPSVFSLKLRKHLRTKRLESVVQLGVDRVIVLTFGSGLAMQHIIMEMYSQGNIILTDGEYNILALLRTHKFDDDTIVAVGNKYPIHIAKMAVPMTLERLDELISSAQKGESVRQVLSKSLDFGAELVEHCILSTGINPDTKLSSWERANTATLLKAVQIGEALFEKFAKENAKGYIILKDGQPQGVTVYEEATPMLYEQHTGRDVKEYPTFNEAVDVFFSQAESQKIDVQRSSAETAAKKKLDKFREEHSRRISSLQEAELTNERRARLIEANLAEVEQCLAVVRSALATGMDWSELASLIKEEKKKNAGSVANLIHRLVLDKNTMTLLLSDSQEDAEDEEDDSGEEGNDEETHRAPKVTRAPELIDVDLGLSGYANARKYFELKKQTTQKAQKTIDKTEQALKAAERKSQKAMKEAKVKQAIMVARKPFWFEKFYWFVSSENFIIVCGRDMQQNEMLYKRYLEKDDVYVHADIHGAATCIIKNPSGGPVPPQTMAQAGVMCACLSAAWSAKVITSAWWVYAHQVSKTAPTGEYLTTGSFMIRGKKNFLPPAQLVLGFGFMFRLDESSIPSHQGERTKSSLIETQSGTSSNNSNDVSEEQTPSATTLPAQDEVEGSDDELDALEEQGVDITKYKVNMMADPEDDDDGGQQKRGDNGSDASSSTSAAGGAEDVEKRRLTAHDRRQIKKGKDPSVPSTKPNPPQPKPDPKPPGKDGNKDTGKQSVPNLPTLKGKKRSKLQEMDEDERAARAQLLGLGGKEKEGKNKGKGKKGKKEKEKAANTSAAKAAVAKGSNVKSGGKPQIASKEKIANGQVNSNHNVVGDAAPSTKAPSAKPNGAPAASDDVSAAEAQSDDPEIRELIEEEENAEEAQKAIDRQTNLDALTGIPRSDDVLLHAIPVIGPYSSMTNYKFKIKITPGHSKRGKAAKAAAEALFRKSDATSREKDLIRAVPLEDLARSMVANVKLHATLAIRKAATRDKHGKDLDFDIIHENGVK